MSWHKNTQPLPRLLWNSTEPRMQGNYVMHSVYQSRTTGRHSLARENTTPCRLDSPPSGRPWQGELRVVTSVTASGPLHAVRHPEVSAIGERKKSD